MAVHQPVRRRHTHSQVSIQKDLPSPPPKYVSVPAEQRHSTKAPVPTSRFRPIERAVTAPVLLPKLSKTAVIERDYDYTPATTVTFTRVLSSAERVQIRQRRPIQRSRSSSLNKPLPPMPPPPDSKTSKDTSSIDSKAESSSTISTAATSIHEMKVPEDDPLTAEFKGDISTTNVLPTKVLLDAAADLPVVDPHGKSIPFKSLYWPKTVVEHELGKKVMVIFIRHFFCGNCQEYIRHLAEVMKPDGMPPRTSIVVIGCGSPTLIPMYISETQCPFPIYADPTKRLYDTLGMAKTLSLGSNDPDYIQRSLVAGALKSIVQGLSRVTKGDVAKAGGLKQVGGEFLFEIRPSSKGSDMKKSGNSGIRSAKVTWCHRMRNTRDHAEIRVIRQVLGHGQEEDHDHVKGVSDSEQDPRSRPASARRPSFDAVRRTFGERRRSWLERRKSSHPRVRGKSGSRSPGRRRANSSASDKSESHKEESGCQSCATPTVDTVAEAQEPLEVSGNQQATNMNASEEKSSIIVGTGSCKDQALDDAKLQALPQVH